ncbi:hypothetical protein Ciccas_012513 [Cichlidogyrus casuarinus]|uniref:Uncharacterized protein n=1 Tax=Cichlidogyrus casuarinus TaxID=1844966 RepID=A0ABD2PN51_9PLAT
MPAESAVTIQVSHAVIDLASLSFIESDLSRLRWALTLCAVLPPDLSLQLYTTWIHLVLDFGCEFGSASGDVGPLSLLILSQS